MVQDFKIGMDLRISEKDYIGDRHYFSSIRPTKGPQANPFVGPCLVVVGDMKRDTFQKIIDHHLDSTQGYLVLVQDFKIMH